MTLADDDLRVRVRRLLEGGRRIEDLDRLYLGLRGRAQGCPAVQEIGDFIAHRDRREKGMITQIGRDVFTSIDVWSMTLRKLDVGRDDFIRAAEANLRLASDEVIRAGVGSSRQMAAARLKKAIAKLRSDQALSESEWTVFSYFGNRFIWRPAFSARQLNDELATVLVRNGLMSKEDSAQLVPASAFLSLHAVAAMHGSSILLDNGAHARLFAGFANKDRWIEVKVDVVFHELGKPSMAPICLFLTNLRAEIYCAPELLVASNPVLVDHWAMPLEIAADGRLAPLAS
ncbi:hypothetical protein [Brevundimonas sanguinis]|uniref:hypothetical protein n=1 Tax=Brevundimonas sanguinis TaxID=3021811 RepID=UPI002414F1AE|nr:hypothetical protein [Brevundimonas sp. NCCP 15609]